MKIKNITLNNFKKFDNISINFTDNINCIVGSNGSGKTTILESIAFCLYGELIDEFRNLPLHRIGTKKLSVNGIFQNSKKLEINRSYSIEGTSYKHDLIINGAQFNSDEKQNIIKDNFGDIEWFDFLISVDQFSHIEFINVTNRSYRKFIQNNIININFEKIKNNLKTIERRLRNEDENNITNFSSSQKEFVKYKYIKNEITELIKRKEVIDKEVNKSRIDYEKLLKKLNDFKNQINKMQYDVVQLININEVLKEIIKNMEKYDRIVDESNLNEFNMDKIFNDVSKYFKNNTLEINKRITNIQNMIDDYNLKINEMEINKDKLSMIIRVNEIKLRDYEYNLDDFESKYKTMSNIPVDIIKIQDKMANDNRAKQKISNLYDLIQKVEDKLIENQILNIVDESNNILRKIKSKYELIYDENHLSLLMDNGIINIQGLSAGEKVFINILIRCVLYKISIKSNFIMIDDPFARLDYKIIKDVLKIFNIINKNGIQIIFTSHNEIKCDIDYNIINLDTINK